MKWRKGDTSEDTAQDDPRKKAKKKAKRSMSIPHNFARLFPDVSSCSIRSSSRDSLPLLSTASTSSRSSIKEAARRCSVTAVVEKVERGEAAYVPAMPHPLLLRKIPSSRLHSCGSSGSSAEDDDISGDGDVEETDDEQGQFSICGESYQNDTSMSGTSSSGGRKKKPHVRNARAA